MVLVTGATGLVGGNLLWYLLQENERVAAICRTTSDFAPLRTIFSFYTSDPDNYLMRIDWQQADMLDKPSLQKLMNEATVVYHCAAVVSLGKSANALLDTNVQGTKNVVEVALNAGVRKLCFVSSIAACGRETGNKPIDETSEWNDNLPRSLYSRSKYYSEQEVWRGIEKGLNAVIVNPGVILGVSGTNKGSSQLFSQVRKGLMFYTKGGSGYVCVQDVVQAMIQLTTSNIAGERFILVSQNGSNKEILSWMADGFGKRRPFIGIGKRTLLAIGYLSQFFGKIVRFKPLIDRGTARSAISRGYYSNAKVRKTISFKFKPIEECVQEICKFMITFEGK